MRLLLTLPVIVLAGPGCKDDDAAPPDAPSAAVDAAPACVVRVDGVTCDPYGVSVSVTGSTGGAFRFASAACGFEIEDTNCNTSSIGATTDPACYPTDWTITHTPCDGSPPCTLSAPIACP